MAHIAPLGNNQHGEPIDLPTEASAWRVRRFKNKGRGAPEVVYDDSGTPLYVALDIGADDFRDITNEQPGRYRLDAVDEHRRSLPEVEPAYVLLKGGELAPASKPSEAFGELIAVQKQMLEGLMDRITEVMTTANETMRMAAGLRNGTATSALQDAIEAHETLAAIGDRKGGPPTALVPGAADADEPKLDSMEALTENIGHLINPLLPTLVPALQSWITQRVAGPTSPPNANSTPTGSTEAPTPAADSPAEVSASASSPGASVDPTSHLKAVLELLSPGEQMAAFAHRSTLSQVAQDQWTARLLAMSPQRAADAIRVELARASAAQTATRNGAPS